MGRILRLHNGAKSRKMLNMVSKLREIVEEWGKRWIMVKKCAIFVESNETLETKEVENYIFTKMIQDVSIPHPM